MPFYKSPTGEMQEITSPELNPQLTQGAVKLSSSNYADALKEAGTISGANLSPQPALILPPAPTDPNYAHTLTSVASNINTYANPAPIKEETQQSELQKRILELTKNIGGKEQYQAQQDQAFGVTESQNQLRDINNQINALHLEAAGIPTAIQEQFKGRGVTAGGVAPIEAGLLRQNTLKALGLSAQGQLIQGNILNAKAMADRAVQLQFAPAENELKYLQTAYNMNKDTLERQDKKRADALKIQLDERERILNNQKENMKVVQGLALTASKNNPNNNAAALAAQQALNLDPNSPDYLSKAYQLIGQYQPNASEMAKDLAALTKSKLDLENNPLIQQKMRSEIKNLDAQAAEHLKKAEQAVNDNKLLSVKDAQNLGVPYGTTVGQARVLGKTPNPLTSTTKTMIETAPTVVHFVDKLQKEISDAENGLGPLASRWREFKAGKVGFSDPAFTAMRTNTALLTTLLMRMHAGARGVSTLLDHFKDILAVEKQSPENLQAGLDEIKDYADFIGSQKVGKTQNTQNTSIKVRNLKTGAIQPYNGTLTPQEAQAAGFEIVQ